MIEAACASFYHWRVAGRPVHRQRAEWMLAHVYTALGEAKPALRHTLRCLVLTQAYSKLMVKEVTPRPWH